MVSVSRTEMLTTPSLAPSRRVRKNADQLKFVFVISTGPEEKPEYSKTSYPTIDAAKAGVEARLQKICDESRNKLITLLNQAEPDKIADAQPAPTAKKQPTPAKTGKETRKEFLDKVRKKIQEMSNPPATAGENKT